MAQSDRGPVRLEFSGSSTTVQIVLGGLLCSCCGSKYVTLTAGLFGGPSLCKVCEWLGCWWPPDPIPTEDES